KFPAPPEKLGNADRRELSACVHPLPRWMPGPPRAPATSRPPKEEGHTMRRGLVVGVQIAVLLLAGASPALSHATFPGQGPLAAQADQTLNMVVPEERDPDTHNVGVTVALPATWTAVHCQATAPWHCTLPPG